MEKRAEIDYGLDNNDIATLSQLAEGEPAGAMTDMEPHRKASIKKLLGCQYIEPAGDEPEAASFKVTPAGLDFLAARGAGLNEA